MKVIITKLIAAALILITCSAAHAGSVPRRSHFVSHGSTTTDVFGSSADQRALATSGDNVPATAGFGENFNNITTLSASGWAMSNQSTTIGTYPTWFQGDAPTFPAQAGNANSYIAAIYRNTTGAGTISNWLLTPNISFNNGDTVTFYTRTEATNTYPDRLQVRLSTSGASTNVGTGPTGVGDFSTLLLDINPTYLPGSGGYPQAWTQFTVTISGLTGTTSGRLAFRYFIENGGPNGINSDYIGIDTFAYTPSVISRRVISDFDGDGKSDISVWRDSDGNWYWINSSNSTVNAFHFGASGDVIVPGDYDGDGKSDFAVFRAGTWYIWGTTAGFSGLQFGLATDLPAQGDFDGDGKTDIAVFRSSNGTWYILASTAGFSATQFGANDDKPVVGDYDGDGKGDIAVYRPSDGNWYQLRSMAGFAGVHFGISTDKVVPADYDGDGKTDLAVYRDGSPGTWFLMESTAGFVPVSFGTTNDTPVPGDFDGDGKSDVGVFRSTNGTWYLQRSTSGFAAQQFGAGTDKPVEASYVPVQ